MRDNPNFINVWFQLALVVVCLAIVSWLVIRSVDNLSANFTGNQHKIIDVDTTFDTPLPVAVNRSNLMDGVWYNVDANYMTEYIILDINRKVKNGDIAIISSNDNNYILESALVDDLHSKYFGNVSSNLNLDRPSSGEYLIPIRETLNDYDYEIIDTTNRGLNYTIVYQETGIAYPNGDTNQSGINIKTGIFTFGLFKEEDNLIIKNFKFEKTNDLPDNYQVVNG